jgi:hypothetical protein
MEDSIEGLPAARANPPTAKEKNAVQRGVNALLDALAPQRATMRGDRVPVPVEQHRTPSGCVLQAPTAALSVGWFADSANDAAFGELHILVWHGVVSRRGAVATPDGASVVREMVLRPVDQGTDTCGWRDADGVVYRVDELAERCNELLKQQMLNDDPSGSARSTSPRRRD